MGEQAKYHESLLLKEERRRAAEARIAKLEKALREIVEQDITELALDPDWPRRIARAALSKAGAVDE